MQSFPPLDERSARAITILLYEEPPATVTEMKRMVGDVYRVCFTDARDGHDHVLLTVGDFIDWIDSIIAGTQYPRPGPSATPVGTYMETGTPLVNSSSSASLVNWRSLS